MLTLARSARLPEPDGVRPTNGATGGGAGGRRGPLLRPSGDGGGPWLGLRRAHAGVLLIAAAAVWLVAVFIGSLGEANAMAERAAVLRADNDALRARLEAGRAEVERIQSDAFVVFQARGYGLGERGEQVFALAPGAPEPDPIVPLGGERAPAPARAPLEDWLDLIFGR